MAIVMKRRPNFHGAYFTLAEVAAELLTTPADLLSFACVGDLRLFVRVPDGVNVCSVHEDAVDIADEQVKLWRFIRKIPDPDPAECSPINMAANGVEGLILSRGDCQQVRDKKEVRQYLFQIGCKTNMSVIEYVGPIAGHFRYLKNPTVSKDGWRLAVYPKSGAVIQYFAGTGYSQPQGVELSIDRLYIAAPDLKRFFDSLDINIFIADLVAGDHFANELPSYVSKKLRFLVGISSTCWAGVNPDDQSAIKAKNSETYQLVSSEEFSGHFMKGEASRGAILAAADVVTPMYARKDATAEEKEAHPGHITPELKVLLAAAKWFWGAPQVSIERPSTYPQAGDMRDFFRMHGMKDDLPKYGVTLIRPEAAVRGSPVEKKSGLRKTLDNMHAKIELSRKSQ